MLDRRARSSRESAAPSSHSARSAPFGLRSPPPRRRTPGCPMAALAAAAVAARRGRTLVPRRRPAPASTGRGRRRPARRAPAACAVRARRALPAAARPRVWGKRARVGLRCVDGAVKWNVFVPMTVKVWAPALVIAGQRRCRRAPRSTPPVRDLAEVDLGEPSSLSPVVDPTLDDAAGRRRRWCARSAPARALRQSASEAAPVVRRRRHGQRSSPAAAGLRAALCDRPGVDERHRRAAGQGPDRERASRHRRPLGRAPPGADVVSGTPRDRGVVAKISKVVAGRADSPSMLKVPAPPVPPGEPRRWTSR